MSEKKVINETAEISYLNKPNSIPLSSFAVIESQTVSSKISTPGGEISITIHKEIPYEQLLYAVQDTLFLLTDANGYISAPVKKAVSDIVLVAYFSNIQIPKLRDPSISQAEIFENYDVICRSGILSAILFNISTVQKDFYYNTLNETILSILNYRNSAAGIVELIAAKNEDLKAQLSDTLSDFNDPDKIQNVMKLADLFAAQTKKP